VKVPRVFLVCTHPLVCTAIEVILRRADRVEVVGIETDQGRALERIQALDPDVVLVEGDPQVQVSLWNVLLLKADLRVIGLSSQDNQISIFDRHQRIVARPQDLIEAICQPEGSLAA